MNFAHLFPQLREALRPATYKDGKTPKARVSKEGKKGSKKGARHIQGKVFLGRQILPMTPAQYRHYHRANPMKANYEKVIKSKKDKWISA